MLNGCWWKTLLVKAAVITIFILTIEQITMCNVSSITHIYENFMKTEKYCLNLQFRSALWCILA